MSRPYILPDQFTRPAVVGWALCLGFLAMAAQAAWNSIDGRMLSSSLAGEGGYLGAFFSPVVAVVGQGYRIWATPEFLVRVQSVVIALGVWPVYLIALIPLAFGLHLLGVVRLPIPSPSKFLQLTRKAKGAAHAGCPLLFY